MSKVQLVKNSSQSLEERGLLRSCIMIPIVTLITIISAQGGPTTPKWSPPFRTFSGNPSILAGTGLHNFIQNPRRWLAVIMRQKIQSECDVHRIQGGRGCFCRIGYLLPGWGLGSQILQLPYNQQQYQPQKRTFCNLLHYDDFSCYKLSPNSFSASNILADTRFIICVRKICRWQTILLRGCSGGL